MSQKDAPNEKSKVDHPSTEPKQEGVGVIHPTHGEPQVPSGTPRTVKEEDRG